MIDEMKNKLAILNRMDVEAFQLLCKKNLGEQPTREVAVISMHKARCNLHGLGHINKKRRDDSKRWLESNGYNIDMKA